ncbi:MAG TPA: glycosyltransferase [Candidatus Hydrogenedentes bacterium]|nr:glycosyltransferase [Candidatus Hydrogenedentota bacterium]
MNGKIGIFIIAYNAESHIAQTLARIPDEVWNEIQEAFVIDDCSTDETVQRAMALAVQYPKLRVLRNRLNLRYGGNQKVGFQYAIDKGYDAVVLLHADGQYAPEYLRQMIAPVREDRADVVLGSRMIRKVDALHGGMPRYKFAGNIALTQAQNRLAGMKLHEFHTGYRAYSVSFLKSVPFWNNTDEWHFDTEILLQAHALNARIVEIPIPTFYGDEICHVNGLAYAWNCVQTTLRYALHRHGVCYARHFDLDASGSKYSSKFGDPYSSHTLLFRHLEGCRLGNQTVLELGVGDSSLTRRLHEQGALVDCIEMDPAAAQAARPFAREVWSESLDITRLDQITQRYDIVIAADILEHLLHPATILSKLKTCVKKGGFLLVSLPNVANIYVRMNLLLGRFPYHTKGLLDNSHLHFYTRKSAERLIVKTGWEIAGREYSSIPAATVFPFLGKRGFRWTLRLLRGFTLLFKGLFCYQYLLYCRNPNESDLL